MDWTWGPADTWQATQRFLVGLASTLPEPPKALLVAAGMAFDLKEGVTLAAEAIDSGEAASTLARLRQFGAAHLARQ